VSRAWLSLLVVVVAVGAAACGSTKPRKQQSPATSAVIKRLFPDRGVSLPDQSVILASGHSPDGTPFILAAVPNNCPTGRAQLPTLIGQGGAFSGPCGDIVSTDLVPRNVASYCGHQISTFTGTVSGRARTVRLIATGGTTVNGTVYELPTKVASDAGEFLLFANTQKIRHLAAIQTVDASGHTLGTRPFENGICF
jgi:hypothetical protein